MTAAARILVVDDDATFRMTTGALLEADGHEVEAAAEGAEAVEKLGAGQFDLVLLA